MKNLFVIALTAAGVATMSAQDCKSLFEQGKKLDDQFNKEKPTVLDPNRQITVEGAMALLNAYDLFMQTVECEKVPNAKGKVEDKLTKKIDKAIKAHVADMDFNKAAIVLFNSDKRYPEAYSAFMISGATTRDNSLTPDTVYAVDFYNAGNCAFGSDFEAAAKAYTEARKANTTEPQVYVYNIASLQQIAQKDSTYAKTAEEEIFAIAKEGVDRFGSSNDFIFGNYIQHYLDAQDYDGAISQLSSALTSDPTNANVYRLRAIVNNAKHDYATAIPDFLKVSELSDKFEYVRDAASNINYITKHLMGQLNNVTPEQKASFIKNFNSALEIAKKAQTLEGADGSVNNLIEDIEYNITNAENL